MDYNTTGKALSNQLLTSDNFFYHHQVRLVQDLCRPMINSNHLQGIRQGVAEFRHSLSKHLFVFLKSGFIGSVMSSHGRLPHVPF